MNIPPPTREKLEVESVVELAREVAGTQAAEGRLLVRERLGPGTVREIGKDGMVRVYWPVVALDTWIAIDDLEPLDPRARVVTTIRYGSDGRESRPICRIEIGKGLRYNWRVEFYPGNIRRTVRADGLAWTFDWHPFGEHAEPHGTILQDALAEDDQAEALAVAELAGN